MGIEDVIMRPIDYRNRWRERVLSERRKYFFQKMKTNRSNQRYSLSERFQWLFDDFTYLLKFSLYILLQLRAFGLTIRKNYSLSLWQQFKRMNYLAFYLQVDPNSLRGRRLYLPQSWEIAVTYTYKHDESQILLAQESYPGEVEIFQDKFMFYQYCKDKNISTPEVLAIFEDGEMIWPANHFAEWPRYDLFIKYLRGKAGQGIRKLMWTGAAYRDHIGNKYTVSELSDWLEQESKKSAIILQKVLVNHSAWSDFTSGALATCRIVTAKLPDDGSVIPLFASLRMPVGDKILDNFSKGGFYSGIALDTGIMSSGSGLKPVNGAFEFKIHPDTGKKVEGTKLPYWEDILEFTLQTHSMFKTFFIGWDVTMLEEGPAVIEGNIGWASRSYECPNLKPLIQTDYPVLYEKWMEKSFLQDE